MVTFCRSLTRKLIKRTKKERQKRDPRNIPKNQRGTNRRRDSLQSRRDESEEGARAAKKTKEEPKEEAAKEEELPDYEGSEDEKPPEKTPKAVAKKRVLSSGSEETDESLKRQIREDLKSDSEERHDEGI